MSERCEKNIKKFYYIGAFIGLIIGIILGLELGKSIGVCKYIPGGTGCQYPANFLLAGIAIGAILGSLGGIFIANIIYKIRLRY